MVTIDPVEGELRSDDEYAMVLCAYDGEDTRYWVIRTRQTKEEAERLVRDEGQLLPWRSLYVVTLEEAKELLEENPESVDPNDPEWR